MTALIALLALGLGDPESDLALPRTLADSIPAESPAAEGGDRTGAWSVGPRVGFVLTPDADHGTWTGGVQFRHYAWSLIALEASVDVHFDSYEGGDQKTAVTPIEISALVFPFKAWSIRPYGLIGIGAIVVDTHYSGSLSSNDDSLRAYVEGHVGLGVEVDLSEKIWIDSDFRWILMQKPKNFSGDSADFLQITIGINFRIG